MATNNPDVTVEATAPAGPETISTPVTGDLPLTPTPPAPVVPTPDYPASPDQDPNSPMNFPSSASAALGGQKQPDLWRRILGTAITAIAGGLMAPDEHPEQSFSYAQKALDLRGQQNFDNQLASQVQAQREAAANRQLDIEQQNANTAVLRAAQQGKLDALQGAYLTAETVNLEKRTAQLPEELQSQIFGRWTAGMQVIEAAGLTPAPEFGEFPATAEGYNSVTQRIAAQTRNPGDFIFGPSPSKPGMAVAYMRDPSKNVPGDAARKLLATFGMGDVIPKEVRSISVDAFNSLMVRGLSMQAAEMHHAEKMAAYNDVFGTSNVTDHSATGDALISQLDPQFAALVKGIADYDIDPNSLRRSGIGKHQVGMILGVVKQYDPSYDQTQYTAKNKLRADFTSGKAANNSRSLNTAVAHLDTLQKTVDELNNGNFPALNKAENWWITQKGDKRVRAFNTAATAVESELAAVFKGMGATDQEIKAWRDNFDSSSSHEQLKAGIDKAIELMGGRLDALRSQYQVGMGKPADFHILNGESRSILGRLGHGDIIMKDSPGQSVSQPTNSIQPIYAVNPQTKQRIVSTDGGNTWQPTK